MEFVYCFRWRLHQRIGKYTSNKNICGNAVVINKTQTQTHSQNINMGKIV